MKVVIDENEIKRANAVHQKRMGLRVKRKIALSDPEPPPKSNDSRPIWELVVEDMKERDRVGRKKYGTPGRKRRAPLIDAYQEALDLCVYLRQAIEEGMKKPDPEELAEGLVALLPPHKFGLYIAHNAHKDVYEKVERCDWISDDERQKAIEEDDMWTIQWYPEPPNGSYALSACSLAVLFRAIKTRIEEEGSR